MKKLMIAAICVGCALATAYADPELGDPAAAGSGSGSGSGAAGAAKDEKAGTNETLQNGGDTRPWAAGVSTDQQKSALGLFREGNVNLNDGLFAKAADKYRQALKFWDHPAVHYNLALAQMNLDQPIDAYDNLAISIKFGEAPLQSKDKFDHAKDYMLLLEKQLADVEVSCDKPGAKVTVDGKEAFTAPGHFKTRVRVGKHTFVAEKQGYTTRINAPYVGPGEHFRIELKLYTAEELTRYHRRWEATWMPYAVMGGGVVIGLVGGVFEYSASSSYRDYDTKVRACNMNNAGCPATSSLLDIKKSGDTKRSIGFVGYGLGAATVVAGGLLALLNRPQAYQIRAEDLTSEKFSVAPVVTPNFAGAMAQGHF